ncbi:MAG: NADH:ubiquinone oxidoreductase 17.2 kD subunit [Candidatus Xenolissoclinum pacificiensis L6]|uniref:NADH:ubiquinone oxidoreductase 17.2 kD subunit n=1 Tax=Candidatus Xenolissoclinum pacificiensis L6 TaxID=1401685 RepID=W2V3A2_9RICK|nr:MAG: NADH:ubiquinone oxidoreductase 17.2 kD subunit [Candidatus Xenolissoclinum pacificiensis L6]
MLFLELRSKFVGSDESGNRYYEYKKCKRFVVYSNKSQDPSTISINWYLWLHYASDIHNYDLNYCWQKPRVSIKDNICYKVTPNTKNTIYYSRWEPDDSKNK